MIKWSLHNLPGICIALNNDPHKCLKRLAIGWRYPGIAEQSWAVHRCSQWQGLWFLYLLPWARQAWHMCQSPVASRWLAQFLEANFVFIGRKPFHGINISSYKWHMTGGGARHRWLSLGGCGSLLSRGGPLGSCLPGAVDFWGSWGGRSGIQGIAAHAEEPGFKVIIILVLPNELNIHQNNLIAGEKRSEYKLQTSKSNPWFSWPSQVTMVRDAVPPAGAVVTWTRFTIQKEGVSKVQSLQAWHIRKAPSSRVSIQSSWERPEMMERWKVVHMKWIVRRIGWRHIRLRAVTQLISRWIHCTGWKM